MSKTIRISLDTTTTHGKRLDELPTCYCKGNTIRLKVKRDTPNYGRYFYKCADNGCKFFKWEDEMDQYDSEAFRRGTCHRCGRYNCDAVDCYQFYDVFGNIIPEDAF